MLARLEEDRARVADLEAQILKIECSLSALRFEKALAQERLDSYKYSVLTLPNEIISEIFIHFIPVYPLCPPLTGILSPTHLTHICRLWRAIALATPALWRSISLSDENVSPFDQPVHISDILGRSGFYPLSIRMDEYEDGDHPHGSEVLAALLPHCARWEYLKLHLVQSRLPTIESRLPLLRCLDLEFDTIPLIVTVFPEVPLLRTVTLDTFAASGVVLPWKQLTALTLRIISFSRCVPILRQAPNLVQCELNLFHDPDEDDQPEADITLPFLESLALDTLDFVPVVRCLHFIAPTLLRLHIPEIYLGEHPTESLMSFISKSDCKLQEMRVTGPRSVTKDSYRAAFPSIPKLTFSGHYVGGGDSDMKSDVDSSDVESDSDSQ
ncbi:hypothetical protein B0H13DRAFT_2551564 [Mycena leptocephala]|nr:hypothetical protein B0H13DRAFT_2551564 [Mycena leptocephala]